MTFGGGISAPEREPVSSVKWPATFRWQDPATGEYQATRDEIRRDVEAQARAAEA